MKKLFFAFLVFIQLAAAVVHAQRVPDNILAKFVKTYADDGFKLEKSIMPDFTRAHPGSLMYYNVCYPGKKILVLTVLAGKPSDWYFKLSYGDQVAPKTHTLTEITFDKNTYYTDWIISGFPSSFNDRSEYCMTIVAYDKNAIDLPVYIYIFSKPN